jgi:purine nucleoside phosphorylase
MHAADPIEQLTRTLPEPTVQHSGAPEIAAATLAGLPAASLVVVTNPCTGIAAAVPSHPDVLRVGREASRRVAALISQLIVNN